MIRRLSCLIAAMAALSAPAAAADLKVISAGAVRGLIAQIIDDYSHKTGQKFDFTIGTTGQLRNIIASGQPADLIIVSAPLMAELEKTGKFIPGSRTDLGRVGIGEEIKKKAVLTKGGREAAIEVAEGRAEMAIVFISEAMAVKGVKLAGPLPGPLQDYSVYATAIPAASTDPEAARAFINALASPEMAVRWHANGFEPPK